MTLQTINLGNYANDSTGDDLRTAFTKVNANFDILRSEVAGATNLGTGFGIYSDKNDVNLEFKSLTSIDNSVIITDTATTVNLQSTTIIHNDITPRLGANLLLNGFTINGQNGTGDVLSTVFGIDVQLLNSIVSLIIQSNAVSLDFGYFLIPAGMESATIRPTGYIVDFGYFTTPLTQNNTDFGYFVHSNT